MFVMQEMPTTGMFMCDIAITSGTVDIPTASAPSVRNARQQHHLAHLVAFVEMHPAAEEHDRKLADVAENHLPRVPDDGGSLRARDLIVRNLSLDFDSVHNAAETGAENHADPRLDFGF